ncbi:MAG: CHC2 zinc finger domain-containing protein [Sphingomonadaceae bacterium]
MSLPLSTQSRSSLEDIARRICESRGGKWSGTKGMACCPAHDDRTPSLGVSLGRQAILFHCFAGCDQQSVLAALAREGFEATSLFSGSAISDDPVPTRTHKPSAAALRIWREAQALRASQAKAYLESRGILAASPALRFHPRTPLGPKGRTRFLPAMIAAVSLDEGPIAVHRTFLLGNAKADFGQTEARARLQGESCCPPHLSLSVRGSPPPEWADRGAMSAAAAARYSSGATSSMSASASSACLMA